MRLAYSAKSRCLAAGLLLIGFFVTFQPLRAGEDGTFFTFTKKGALFDTPTGMPGPGPYYTCLVKMDKVAGFPFEYALYFSSDHDNGKGGIWLYLGNGAPSEKGNWKSYDRAVADGDFNYLADKPAHNPIFIDRLQGTQTETPHVNVIDGKVYMTYHNVLLIGSRQATMLAISPDGVNFARYKGARNSIILPNVRGGNHTGYFRWAPNPFPRVNYKFAGYSLHGGGDNYHSAIWGSNDAINWDKIAILTPKEGLAMPDDMIMIWHEIDPASARQIGDDEFVLLSAGGNRASGPAARVVEIYEIFLAGDGKTFTRTSRKVLPHGPPGSPDCEETAEPTTVQRGDTIHMISVGACAKGGQNTVMSAVGKFNPDAPPATKLQQ